MRKRKKSDIYGLVPTQNVYSLQEGDLLEEVRDGRRIYGVISPPVDKESLGQWETIRDTAEAAGRMEEFMIRRTTQAAGMMANFHQTPLHSLVWDLGFGLFRMVTTDSTQFENVHVIQLRRVLKGGILAEKADIAGVRIEMNEETFHRALFGSLIGPGGRPVVGAARIVRENLELLRPYIEGEKDKTFPRMWVSDNWSKAKVIVEGQPVGIYRKVVQEGETQGRFVVTLDSKFFPIKSPDGKKVLADSQYIHTVRGLHSFLQFGASLYEDKFTRQAPLSALAAKRIITAAQMGFEKGYGPRGMSVTRSGRRMIKFERSIVRDLVPQCADPKTGWVRWAEFSSAIATAGKYYMAAAEKVPEVFDEMKAQGGHLLMLAQTAGAMFPSDQSNIVVIFADPFRQ